MLAQLQRANIGDDGPAIAWRDLRGIVGHRAKTVGHYIVEITMRRLPQPVNVIGGRAAETSLHNHAVAITELAMANAAKNVVALGATIEQGLGQGQRENI